MIGIIGAIVLRTVMILVGAWLIAQFHWVLYVFGALPGVTGIKMWWAGGQGARPGEQPGTATAAPLMPVSPTLRWREVLHRAQRPPHRHAAVAGDRAGRA
jgi:predicted tellurium resistance membrane protein TerC